MPMSMREKSAKKLKEANEQNRERMRRIESVRILQSNQFKVREIMKKKELSNGKVMRLKESSKKSSNMDINKFIEVPRRGKQQLIQLKMRK